jgi:hypothetical protein
MVASMKDAHRWIDFIIEKLFENDRSKVIDQVIELTQNNNIKKSCSYIGFRHMGKTFLSRGHNIQLKGKQSIIPSLAFELAPVGTKIVQQTNNLDRDEKEIRQILFKILDNCISTQDIRDSLPEPVVQLIPELAKTTRRANVAYWMSKDKLTLNEFNRLLPKIEAYAISKLFY